MLRRGGVKQEFLLVLLFVAILGGLAVMLTMRQDPINNESFVREELVGKQPSPQSVAKASEELTVQDVPGQDVPADQQKTITTESGLKIIDKRIGTGDKVKVGTKVSVYYTGTLQNGEKFDSNVGKRPYPVTVGTSPVIKGWHEGLIGMQKGGKRRLIIPYQLAYGTEGDPPKIPARAELTFEIEVVDVSNR
jgi:FKBP-type peptidyl-prolyl cis-trans isomerase